MPSGWGGSIVANRQRQKMEHQVRVCHQIIASCKPSCFKIIGGRWALPKEKPLKTDPRFIEPSECRLHRNWLGARMLHINLQMVLQVFSNSWEFLNYFDTQGLKFIQVPNARKLQKLRRIEGASTGDDFSTLNAYCLPFVAESRPTALFPSKRMHNAWARHITLRL